MAVRGVRGLWRAVAVAGLLVGAGVSGAQGVRYADEALAAEQGVERADAAVQGMERSGVGAGAAGVRTLSDARAERSERVLAWRRAADAWAAAEPGSAAAKAAVAQSIKAMEAFYVPGGGLAPDAPGNGNEP